MQKRPLILASASAIRRKLLEDAGFTFSVTPAHIDERAIEAGLVNPEYDPAWLARELARQKALDVSQRHPGSLIIGCDQTLSLDGRLLHKASHVGEARKTLEDLRGRVHHLSSAVALVENGDILWDHVSVAEMKVRSFSDEFLNGYLERNASKVLSSVGCYQLESEGVHLFDEIRGDYFTVLGLPLLPLLAQLRKLDVNHV